MIISPNDTDENSPSYVSTSRVELSLAQLEVKLGFTPFNQTWLSNETLNL